MGRDVPAAVLSVTLTSTTANLPLPNPILTATTDKAEGTAHRPAAAPPAASRQDSDETDPPG